MADLDTPYKRILTAVDFSPASEAALHQAVWLARTNHAPLVLAHTLPDLRELVTSSSYEARMDFLYGSGDMIQQEIRKDSDEKLQAMIAKLGVPDLQIRSETLLGKPYLSLTHAVQKEGYDLVVAGTRGTATWERFLIGSTAKRLIRLCPASVWIVKDGRPPVPKVVLAATDLSPVSRKALLQGLAVARQAGAEFHLLHVIDSADVPNDVVEHLPQGSTLREEINKSAERRLDEFLAGIDAGSLQIRRHLSWGYSWREIATLQKHLHADLLVLGTIGRTRIKGLLLGNTAEKVLDTCDCSILTVKPDDFVSPIDPPFWPLHPESETKS
ncbi:MAG: universal stress protein [Planctomycetales bacterium]